MISSVTIKSGFAARLPHLSDRTFSFTDGINVLVGPNGCGKSTLLKVIAGHTGTDTRDPNRDDMSPNFKEISFPDHFRYNTVGGVSADLGWNGDPCMLSRASEDEGKRNNPLELLQAMEGTPGAEDFGDALARLKACDSDGQYRLRSLGMLTRKLALWRFTSVSQPCYQDQAEKDAFSEYELKLQIESLNGDKVRKNTLLLDEPERSLNITNELTYWKLLPEFARKLGIQIIVASHSVVPLFLKKGLFNIVDVTKGYSASAKSVLTELVLSSQEDEGKDPSQQLTREV